MKLFFALLFSSFCLFSQAQLLNLSTEWFTEGGFFNEEIIQQYNIGSIGIYKSTKLDGAYFSSEKEALKYLFNSKGQLKQSFKFTSFTNKIDSSSFHFFYTKKNNIYKRIENEGPFSFTYYFIYQDKNLVKEIKIDNNSPCLDTAYIRLYNHEWIDDQIFKTTYYNSIQRPYQYKEEKFDLFGQLVYQKIQLARSLNFSEKKLSYTINQLTEKQKFTSIGKQQSHTWKYSYKKGVLDLIQHYNNDILIEKIGFTYQKDGLLSAIVTRDLKRKSVIIYKFNYTFLD